MKDISLVDLDLDVIVPKVLKAGLFVGGGYLLYLAYKKNQAKTESTHLFEEAGTTVDTETNYTINLIRTPTSIATALKIAMNPSGVDYMMDFDGTEEEPMYAVAKETHPNQWEEVVSSYSKLFNRNLLTDLVSELGADEFNTFQSNLGEAYGRNFKIQ
jgi:hypothetical protein